MSKKVVRLTESQLRLMISKVISEQKTPASAQKAKPQQASAKPEVNYNDNNPVGNTEANKLILQEALTYASNDMFTYVSKLKPGFIAMIVQSGSYTAQKPGSLLKEKPESYGPGMFGSHEITIRFSQVSKEKSSVEDQIHFNLNAYTKPYVEGQGGQFIEGSIPFKDALNYLNNGSLQIQQAKESKGGRSLGPGNLLYQLNWAAGLTTEQAFQLMRRAVPDIYVALINDLKSMEYQADTREQKNYLQAAMNTIEKIAGQQKQQQQQQPVNENKKRRV